MRFDDPVVLRELRRTFTAISVVCLIAFAALTAFVVTHPEASGFDLQVAAHFFRDAAENDLIAGIGRALDLMGGNLASFVIVLVVFILLMRSRHRYLAAYLLASAIGGVLLSSMIKGFVERPRPQTVGLLLAEGTSSYPSGHSTAAVAVFGALALVALAVLSPRVRVWVGSMLLVFGVAVGLSRIWLGVHWPTDVIGGWLLGATWTCAVAAVVVTTVLRDHARAFAG